ncbi:sporulation rmd8 protein [Rutstroemia sp. NJR-2017a BBW]|nr:sporulation rmd8 protein [Rutstroemia sp. NJR-2017a BBW]
MATQTAAGKRGPSVLVTDSRERQRPSTSRSNSQRPSFNGTNVAKHPTPTRFISVDSVLQYASQIPSGQARGPPGRRPQQYTQRRASIGPITTRIAQQNVPGRSTKVSEKLVLLPETVDEKEDSDVDELLGADNRARMDGEIGPLTDIERDVLKKRGGIRGKSYAERLPKAKRANELARVTAYCTAQAYRTMATATFVKEKHGAKTKLYDDCLYTVYHLPLLPGSEGFRVRSSPVLKSPGGKAVLDEEIERSENRDYHEGYFEDTDTYGVRGGDDSPRNETDLDRVRREEDARRKREETHVFEQGKRADSPNRLAPDAKTFAEMFVFSYGVVVFWNFTEHQEKDILADLTFSEHNTGVSLVTRPQDEDDFETEELHFEYSPFVDRPRIFNDMITLRSGDHMIKLAMSHAIAQSTKLSFFEERMSQTMISAEHVPKHLALTGQLGLSRTEVLKILGRLFKSRVDVNLSSNILDVPNFFWDSEPTLHPLYTAIREYLEIGPRIKTLNERCRVFLDLAEVLSDSIADTKMSTITWIVIILIVISIAVTLTEVGLRFAILEREAHGHGHGGAGATHMTRNWTRFDFDAPQLEAICGKEIIDTTFADLRV